MDYESALISKVLASNSLDVVLNSRLPEDVFVSHRDVWKYIKEVYSSHGSVPPKELVQEKFPTFSFRVDDVVAESFLIDELRKRHLHNVITDSIKNQAEKLKAKDPFGALEEARQLVIRADLDTQSSRDVNFVKDIQNRLDRYEEATTSGEITGVPTPWDCFNEVTQGFHEEDLIMIAGRSKVGKTWSELVLSWHNWKTGYIPLVFSKEMAVWQMVRRLDAINAKLPYKRFRSGELTSEEKNRWLKALEELEGKNDYWIIGDDFTSSSGVSGIRAKIQKYKPHIVYIDGAYIIKDERKAKQKWEQFSNVCEDLKRLAQSEKVPIVLTHQFNLAGKGMEGSGDTLKFGDVIMWFDLVIGCYRDEALIQNKEMLYKIVNSRESENLEWVAEHDLENMSFDEKKGLDDISDGEDIPYGKEEIVEY